MKLINCKLIIIALLLLPFGMWANDNGKFKKEKTIRKAYNVSGNVLMDIGHKYGMITVTTWDQNRAEIDVLVRVTGNNEKEVNERFDKIGVDFKTGNNSVIARSSMGGYACNQNITTQVNFIVKMPKSGRVKLDNEYGHIRLSEVDGPSTITCRYGQINVDALNNTTNTVKIEYSGGCRIGYMKGGSLTAQYSDIMLANSEKVTVTGEYSNVKMKNVDDMKYKCSYGEINVENADIVTGRGDYATSRFTVIKKLANLTADYGHINIGNVERTVKNIAITSTYTSVNIGYDEDYPFDFEVYLKYNGLQAQGLKYTTSIEKNENSYYKGYNKNSGINKIFIKSEYAPVKFIRK